MNKAEWNAMNASEKNILVAKNVMGLTVFEFEPGTNSRLFCAVPLEEIDNPEYCDEFLKRYTTDRNACALVLDEIEKRWSISRFVDIVIRECGLLNVGERCALFYGLKLSPDDICYCALKSIE